MVGVNNWVVLLLVASASASAAPSVETFTTVQLRFACAPKEAPVVELAASFETQVALPRGCPGGSLSLRLACDETNCLGVVHLPGAAETKLQGPRERVVAAGLPSDAPITLAGLQLETLSTRKQEMTESYASLADLWLTLEVDAPKREMSFRVRPENSFWVGLGPDVETDPHALELIVHRRSRTKASVEAWTRAGQKVLAATMSFPGVTETSCHALGLACDAPVHVRVAENDGSRRN